MHTAVMKTNIKFPLKYFIACYKLTDDTLSMFVK